MKTAAIYARISKDREGRELGVQRQEDLCKELAAKLGFSVVGIFIDNDISASTNSTKPRPQFDQMLQRARLGEFNSILAYSNSRLTRRPREFIDLIDLFKSNGIVIHTVASSDVDLGRAEGRALGITVAAWDAAEAERTSERIRESVKQRAKSGRWHGGAVPYGYVAEGDRPGQRTLVPHPPEVVRIEDAAKRILAGDSMQSIANDWNSRGLTTRGGKHWRNTNLRAILTNRSLLGETTIRDQNGKRIQGVKGWEPVIDQRTFDRLQRVFTDPARKVTHSPGVRGGKYSMGGGLTVCAVCGHRLITASHHGKPSLGCNKKVNGPDACGRVTVDHTNLERYVFETVVAALKANPRWNQRLAEPDPDNDAKITKLEVDRADLVEQQRRLNDAWIMGNVDEPHYRTHVERIKSELEAIERKINDLLGSTVMTDAIADGLDWESWPPMRRRNFMRLAVRRIEVGPYPKGVPFGLPRRGSESDGEYETRRQAHINRVMTERVTIVV
ncbi:recombinase family protein [Herbiconiux sp. YIM B11900]|uniref:recombinase family protein n=1 Tax=Herbiconiux sp. YIM B11900 TaxID=3404131 RepID=UPI003F844332